MKRIREKGISRLDAYKSKLTEKKVSSTAKLTVLSTGAQGTGKSFLLVLEHDR